MSKLLFKDVLNELNLKVRVAVKKKEKEWEVEDKC